MAINERATIDLSVNAKKAQDELEGLRKKAQELQHQIDAATAAGDTKGIKRIRAELDQTRRDMKKVERAAFDVNKVLGNLSGASINDINRAIRQMEREMKALPQGTAKWKAYRTEIDRCRDALRKINNEGKRTEGWLGRANNAFNKWGAGITAAVAAVTGLTLTISKMRDMAKEKEDAQAQLQALTGLDDNSIAWLTQQAEQLSTSMTDGGLRIRQSATEILKAYQLVGGAKPELLENKEALNAVTIETMRLATASGMELTEAVNGVTLAMNQYGATAEEVSRYTNTLAAGAKFGSAEVDSVTAAVRRAGVAASTAGIPIEALVGAIEMLAERGIPVYISPMDGWDLLFSVLKEFPSLTVIITNYGLWGSDGYIYPLVKSYPNVYLDTSDLQEIIGIEAFVRRFGSERLLFGTNYPMDNMGGPLAALFGAKIGQAERENIAFRNFERLNAGRKLK